MASTDTTTAAAAAAATTAFEVYVSKDTFKFNAAHFVAFAGYRERLHGHNYRVAVRLLGRRRIGADGYLIDFGTVKAVTKQACHRLNEYFLCPVHSDVLTITTTAAATAPPSVRVECHGDGSVFVFPAADCAMLPIVHATAEELAIYLYAEILNGLQASYLLQRGIHTMEVSVAEAVGQEATFRLAIPETSDGGAFHIDVLQFITAGQVIPMPCLPVDSPPLHQTAPPLTSTTGCASGCSCSSSCSSAFTDRLAQLAKAINDGRLNRNDGEPVSTDALLRILENSDSLSSIK